MNALNVLGALNALSVLVGLEQHEPLCNQHRRRRAATAEIEKGRGEIDLMVLNIWAGNVGEGSSKKEESFQESKYPKP